jgi:hypothetical protein
MVANAVHVIFGLVGMLFLYAGFFLTETEEGQLQNRLQELWIRVDDLQSRALTRQAAFLQQASSLVAEGFGRVFGPKLVSVKSVASCLCFSMASLYLSLALFGGDLPLLSKRVLFTCTAIFFACGFSKKFRYISFAVLALAAVLEIIGLKGELKAYQSSPGDVALGYFFYATGIFGGVGFIALTRWSMKLASHLSNAPGLIATILSNLALSAALVGPLIVAELLAYHVSMFGPKVGPSVASGTHGWLTCLIFLCKISISNLFTALAALVVVLVPLVALLHRLVWPVISRPIYAAHRHGLIAQHNFLTALGFSCLLLAWPNNIVVRTMAKIFHFGT